MPLRSEALVRQPQRLRPLLRSGAAAEGTGTREVRAAGPNEGPRPGGRLDLMGCPEGETAGAKESGEREPDRQHADCRHVSGQRLRRPRLPRKGKRA